MANNLTVSFLCGIIAMAFVVEIQALDCSNAGDMMFLCLSGNKKRTADSEHVVQGTRSAGQESGRRRHVAVAPRREDQDNRELADDDEALKSRLFEIASRLLESKDTKSRTHSDYEPANQRGVEQEEDQRDLSETAMFEDRDVKNAEVADARSVKLDEERRDVDTGKALESARKQLLSRWLNEGRTFE